MTNYECLEDRVLLKVIKQDEDIKTASGIDLSMKKRETSHAEVVNVGVGYTTRDTGVFIPTVLHKGDVVLIGSGGGLPVDIPDETGGLVEHLLMREGDVLALVKKNNLEQ